MNNPEDSVLAQLGIQLERPLAHSIADSAPTDEELACLFEGTIGERRKAEILTHIARDEDTYLRWKNCVEINLYAQELMLEEQAQQIQPSNPLRTKSYNDNASKSLLDKISDLIFGKNPMVLGGGLATAACIVFITTLVINNPANNLEMDIELLYENYGVALSQSWNENTHTQHSATFASTRSFFSSEKTPERKLIESGFKNGIKLLNSKMFADIGINEATLADITAVNSLDEMTLFELGKVSAITTIQCEQQLITHKIEDQLIRNDLIMQDIFKNLNQVNTREIQEIKVAYNDSSKNITERVCASNYAIVQLISK